MKKSISLFLLGSVLLTSCSTMFRTKKVNILAPDSSSVYINDNFVGDSTTTIRLKDYRYRNISVLVEKEGYKSKHGVIYPDKGNPGTWVSILNPLNIVFPIVLFEAFGYHKSFSKDWDYNLTPYPNLSDSSQHVVIERFQLDSNFTFASHYYKSPNKYKKKKTYEPNDLEFNYIRKTKDKITENHSESTSYNRMNGFLNLFDLNKTKEDIHLINYGEYNIKINVLGIDQHVVRLYKNPKMKLFDVHVDYTIIDKYGKELIKKNITTTSDPYMEYAYLEDLFYDAMRYNFMKLMEDEEVFNLFDTKEEISHEFTDKIGNYSESTMTSFDSLSSIAVYLKQNDRRIVAFPISKDGYVAISKSAALFQDSLYIFNAKGDSALAELHYEIAPREMAILKTDMTFDNHLGIDKSELNVGDENIVSGFDRSFNTLILSKGIISGKREQNDYHVYQMDAETNYMIYPIVLSKEGKIRGFVSRRLNDFEVNSISFFPSLN